MTDDDEKDIADLPSFKELEVELEQLRSLINNPLLRKILEYNNVDVGKISRKLDEVSKKRDRMSDLSDRFNDEFWDRGWIMYWNMSGEVAEAALKKAEQGEFDIAEDLLISHYDPKEIKRQIDRLRTIEAFEPRVDLAYNAWKDYSEERYHAVVPVVLSLIEGLVLQTCVEKLGHRKGFFYKTANFTAWDSIAAHEKGLERLADRDLLLQSRNSTTTETIDIPYRHGIVHGLDLGYDNKAVAAKSWAILFAVGEWARKAYKNELEKPEDTDNIDLSSPQKIKEVFQQIDEQRQRAERRQEWEPRKIEVGVDIPAEAEPDAYNEGTPERVLMETLHAWKQEQWGLMPDAFVDVAGNQPHVEEISDQFENLDLKSVKLLDIYRFAPALCEITVKLGIKRDDEIEWEEKTITLEYRASEGRIGFPEMDEGHWAIKNRHVFY